MFVNSSFLLKTSEGVISLLEYNGKHKIQTALTLVFAVLVLLIFNISMIKETQRTVQRGIEERANQAVLAAVKIIRDTIVSRSVYVKNLSLSLAVPANNRTELLENFFTILNQDNLTQGVYIAYVDGGFVSAFREGNIVKEWLPPDTFKPKERFWYKLALEPSNIGQVAYSQAYIDAASGNYIVTISQAIQNLNNEIIGVVGVDISLEQIKESLTYLKMIEFGSLLILDSAGNFLVHPDSSMVTKSFRSDQGEIKSIGELMVKGEEGWDLIKSSSMEFLGLKERTYIYYQPISKLGWSVAVLIPETVVNSSSKTNLFHIGLSGILLLMGVLLLIVSTSVKQTF